MSLTKYQEELRKHQISLLTTIEKQKDKILACENQIELLSQSVKELSESGAPRLEEKGRIWKVKDKIRDVIEHKKKDIEDKTMEIREVQQQVRAMDATVESVKQELDSIEMEQVQHYYQVLQIGIDTRQDGLSWVLKTLWTLGENVKISKLPTYLDFKAINFLFAYSKLMILLNENIEQSKMKQSELVSSP